MKFYRAVSLAILCVGLSQQAIGAQWVDRVEYDSTAECIQNFATTPDNKCTPAKLKSLRLTALTQARTICAQLFGRPGNTTVIKDLGNRPGPISMSHSSIVRTLKVACEADLLNAKLSIPHLISVMGGKDNSVPFYAQKALVQLGALAKPALVSSLKDKNFRLRVRSIGALGLLAADPEFKNDVQAFVSAVAPLLADNAGNGGLGEGSVSGAARAFLEDQSEMPDATLKSIFKIIEEDRVEASARANSIMVVAKFEGGAKEEVKKQLIPILINALQSKGDEDDFDLELLLSAAQHALSDLGQITIPDLVNFLDREPADSRARIRAGRALAAMAWKAGNVVLPPEILPRLLGVPDPEVRYEAAVVVSGLVFKGGPANLGNSLIAIVKGLENVALSDQEQVPHSSANPALESLKALGDIGPEARAAKPTLLKVLNQDPRNKQAIIVEAALSVGRILGKDGKEALPRIEALKKIFADISGFVATLDEAIQLIK